MAPNVQLYSDERGVCRNYAMQINSKQWILQREGEPFAQRFIGTISDDARTISGRSARRERVVVRPAPCGRVE